MLIRPIKTSVFKEGDDLVGFIRKHVPKLKEDTVLVITSKIVALAEGRTAIKKDEQTKKKLIHQESDIALKTKYSWLTIRAGVLMSVAGIDESNGNGKFILLPKDSFRSAAKLRTILQKVYRVKNLGVLITDSRTLPLRKGAVGTALGYAGFKGIKDYRKTPDIFGRFFHVSQANIADGLASSAVLAMGEGGEQQPLAVIEGAPVVFSNTTKQSELFIAVHDDLFIPYLSKLLKRKA
ncbi:MAG: coenzyme F420-0:L-glutamate ligase [Minisyncoccia bacterium]